MQEQPRPFDICILCALYEEASAVINEFETRCGVSFTRAFRSLNQLEYRHATIQNQRGESLTVFVTWLSRMGGQRTALDLSPLLYEIRIKAQQTVKWKTPLSVEIDESRDEDIGNTVPLHNATDGSSKDKQVVHVEARLCSCWWSAHHHTGAQDSECINGLSQHLGAPGCLERKGGPTAGNVLYLLNHIRFKRIQGVGSP